MNYQEALDYLVNLTKFGYNFGLSRIQHLLSMLGNPHDKLKTIHIGGTNGKGSTSAILSSVLISSGYKVGVFTSPHLHSYRERVVINGAQIPEANVAELISRLKVVLEKMVSEGQEHPTEFEVNTALALLYFAEENVDIAVIEVGLGGAIDSTNVITPLVSVITNVGMDHMDYLGQTVGEIARVKAGIIKQYGIVVTAAERPEALEVIEDVCRVQKTRLIRVQQHYEWTSIETSPTEQVFDLIGCGQVYRRLTVRLAGDHQLINATTAIAVIEVLKQNFSFDIGEKHIYEGLCQTVWPGRLEQIRPGVLLDGAHNVDGALTLRRALESIFRPTRLILCIGMLADKERGEVLSILAPLAEVIVVTKPNSPRAGEWQEMAGEAEKYVPQVFLQEDISSAVDLAISMAGENDLVCITGSLYMIAEARAHLLAV